ncbi:hypothetical protein KM043_002604 [Ampulex compressa]|nr:hypothetical protein KM043_002604 [Ampulex compressa]
MLAFLPLLVPLCRSQRTKIDSCTANDSFQVAFVIVPWSGERLLPLALQCIHGPTTRPWESRAEGYTESTATDVITLSLLLQSRAFALVLLPRVSSSNTAQTLKDAASTSLSRSQVVEFSPHEILLHSGGNEEAENIPDLPHSHVALFYSHKLPAKPWPTSQDYNEVSALKNLAFSSWQRGNFLGFCRLSAQSTDYIALSQEANPYQGY